MATNTRPRQRSIIASSRKSACLIRSHETARMLASSSTSGALVAEGELVSEAGKAAPLTMNWRELLCTTREPPGCAAAKALNAIREALNAIREAMIIASSLMVRCYLWPFRVEMKRTMFRRIERNSGIETSRPDLGEPGWGLGIGSGGRRVAAPIFNLSVSVHIVASRDDLG